MFQKLKLNEDYFQTPKQNDTIKEEIKETEGEDIYFDLRKSVDLNSQDQITEDSLMEIEMPQEQIDEENQRNFDRNLGFDKARRSLSVMIPSGKRERDQMLIATKIWDEEEKKQS